LLVIKNIAVAAINRDLFFKKSPAINKTRMMVVG
jgi:hypothetical protein